MSPPNCPYAEFLATVIRSVEEHEQFVRDSAKDQIDIIKSEVHCRKKVYKAAKIFVAQYSKHPLMYEGVYPPPILGGY